MDMHAWFSVGDRVVRKGTSAPVGEIMKLIPAVEYPYYAAHKDLAYVRWPDRSRLGGSGYKHTTVQQMRLARAQPDTTAA